MLPACNLHEFIRCMLWLIPCAPDGVLDEPNEQLVELLMREEVVRHVTAMYTLERIAARDWARTRTLMASINQVRGTGV